MKVVVSWVKEYCPSDLTPEELAELLTSKGAEVEEIERPWDRLRGVVVARVLEVRDHPNSDTLCLARVSTGDAEREVVVGVRNMKPDDLVPLAGPGATVPALPEPLSARRIRGVVSDGMLCSPWELGITTEHTGILVIPDELEPGTDFKQAYGLDESVLDIEVTPNRPDFLSVIGIAREVSAATGVPLRLPDVALEEDDEKVDEVATVEILDLDRCPRYLARIVRGIAHSPSPIRVQARLTVSGMRPLSAAVDATNYAMLEIGQPLHPFDLSRLKGPGIVIRRANDGERLVTLDGVERAFTSDDLLICDTERPVAVAGVMGGAVAEMSESTADVLLESAWFERGGIQRTRRRIGLSTEASMRFERGTDPEAVPLGADRASRLMAEWCGGRVLAGSVEAGGAPERRHVSMRPSRASLVIGYPVSATEAAEAFDRLGMSYEVEDEDLVGVEVPGYRVDIEREVDLIEEVVRVQGYDRVGSTVPPVRQAGGVPALYGFRARLRGSLRRSGLREVRLLSFASKEDVEMAGGDDPIRITNPLQADESYLRTRLLPGLLNAVQRNVYRHVRGVALFEVGTVFRMKDGAANERSSLALAMTGPASQSWAEPPRSFDLFDAKGALEALLEDAGIRDWSMGPPAGWPFHPARSAAILAGTEGLGVVGEIHPSLVEQLDLGGRVAAAEVDVQALMAHTSSEIEVRDVPRYPPVRRDLAFVLDATVPAAPVQAALREAGGELVETCLLFDVFSGPPLPEGKKSLAFSIDLRAPDRTLTDNEADAVVHRIAEHLASEFGAELRAG
ncbi:MAG TPA: phenylalanine--tRNA ligase subunit beta [Actinomycetota bacterium]|nr:phenylalanine--tRNA ligase subunit beta [Actinomycetota bacterium]